MSLLDEEDIITQETEKVFDEQLLYYMACSKLDANPPFLDGLLQQSQMEPDTVYICARTATIWTHTVRGYWIGNKERGWKKCTYGEYRKFLQEYLNKNNITIKSA